MKKYAKYLLCLLIGLAITINSCKKDNLLQNASTAPLASAQISAQEITSWFLALPQPSSLQPQWSKASKSTINGQDVIQIPFSNNASLFFTKTNGF